MAFGRNRESHPAWLSYIDVLNEFGVGLYSDIVDEHVHLFMCSKCKEVPRNECFISTACQHPFCKQCTRDTFINCPLCGKVQKRGGRKKKFVKDPGYPYFYECYKRQQEHRRAEERRVTVVQVESEDSDD